MGNYRPISLLPQFAKIFEKVMAKRLTDFLNANDVLTSKQFGFRKSHSTELAAVDVYDHLLRKLHEKQITCSIFLDLSKAFDSVNHKIVLISYINIRSEGHLLDCSDRTYPIVGNMWNLKRNFHRLKKESLKRIS